MTFEPVLTRCQKCFRIEKVPIRGTCLNCGHPAFDYLDQFGRTESEAKMNPYELTEEESSDAGRRNASDKRRKRQDWLRSCYDIALTVQGMSHGLTLGYPAPYGPWQIDFPPHDQRRDGSKESWIIRGDTTNVGECFHRYEDAAWFAQSRWTVPQLCSRIFELYHEVARLDKALEATKEVK